MSRILIFAHSFIRVLLITILEFILYCFKSIFLPIIALITKIGLIFEGL